MATAPEVHVPLMSAQQLLEHPDDGLRHELVEGRLTSMVPAGGRHGRTGARLLARVDVHVEAHGLGEVFTAETGFLLRRDPDTVRAPDLAFVRAERASEALVPGFPALAPDLVAEVVSPSDRVVEVAAKAQEWLDAGVRLVWVVDAANRTVTTYRADRVSVLRGDGVLSGEDVLTGLAVPLADLWV